MTKQKVHINWGACADWLMVRARLKFLHATLYGNFCDAECNITQVKHKLESLGYVVSIEDGYNGTKGTLLRVSDKPTEHEPGSYYYPKIHSMFYRWR